jgi:peptide chain release factor subunit 3
LVVTDAGKSTIGGQIMNLTGMVDKRTLEKYEREAKEKSRETWYLSWALDTNQEGECNGENVGKKVKAVLMELL